MIGKKFVNDEQSDVIEKDQAPEGKQEGDEAQSENSKLKHPAY